MINKTFEYNFWLLKICKNSITYVTITQKISNFKIKKKFLLFFLLFLKMNQNCLFSVLNDLCVIDFPFKIKRFTVVYNLLSQKFNKQLFISVNCKKKSKLQTISFLFKSANWLEREAFDLFGVFFFKHKNLRRLLTDYGFEGNPMLKNFPLTGFNELLFDYTTNKIIFKPIEFAQNFRNYNFTNWNNFFKKNIKKNHV